MTEAPPQPHSAFPQVAEAPGGILVGRAREIAELQAVLDQGVAGRGGLVALVGEPGIGKTAIAERASAMARDRGALTLWGRCWEGGGAPPYWPWVQVIRAYLQARPRDEPLDWVGDWMGELSQLVPELGGRRPSDADISGDGSVHDRWRLFEAIARFVREASTRQPLMVVLDDAHAADEPSVEVLKFVAPTLRDSRTVLLCAYRRSDGDARRDTLRQLQAIERHGRRLDIAGLGPHDTAGFVNAAAPGLGDDVVAEIHRVTEGNPFFVDEIVRLLVRSSPPNGHHSHHERLRIPETVRDAIRRRLRPLAEDIHRCLAVAAIIGRDFDVAPLQAIAERPTNHVLDLVGRGVETGVLTRPDGSGRYRFTHGLIRETLLDDLTPADHSRLHRRAGEVLEKLYAADAESHIAELAHHFLEALPDGDPAHAVDYAERAAKRATSVAAYEEAVAYLMRALETIDLYGADDRRRAELLVTLGAAQWRAGDPAGARASYERAATVARTIGAAELLARAALGLGGGRIEAGAVDPTLIRLLEDALKALGDDEPALRSRLLGRLAVALYFSGTRHRCADLSREAVAIARTTQDPATLAAALGARHFAIWGPDSITERVAVTAEVMQLGEGISDNELLEEGRLWRIVDLLELGDVHEAGLEIDALEKNADELRVPIYVWSAALFRAMDALKAGRFAEAERLAQGALGIGQKAGLPNALHFFGAQLVTLRREQGRLDELQDAIRGFIQGNPGVPLWRCTLALLHAELGDRPGARQRFEVLARDDFRALPKDGNWLTAMALLSEVCAFLGDATRAGILYEQLAPYSELHIVIAAGAAFYASVEHYLGTLAMTAGRIDDAVEHFERAIARNAAAEASVALAHTHHALAEALLARDSTHDRSRATAALDQALESFRTLGIDKAINVTAALRERLARDETRGSRAEGSASTKLIPPGRSRVTIERPTVTKLLEQALTRRLTIMVAAAGFGKSTALATWRTNVVRAWYTLDAADRDVATFAHGVLRSLRLKVPRLPRDISDAIGHRGPQAVTDEPAFAEAVAAVLAEALETSLARDLVLVLDDAHAIGDSESSRRFLEALVRQAPARLHVVIASQLELPLEIERLRGQGEVLEITAVDLSFSRDDVDLLARECLSDGDAVLASMLHELTSGWPAGVRLAMEALRPVRSTTRHDALARLRDSTGELSMLLITDVLERQRPDVMSLVRTIAPLPKFDSGLCTALGIPDARDTIAVIEKEGVLFEPRRADERWLRVNALVRDLVSPPSASEAAQSVRAAAARWFEAGEEFETALACLDIDDDQAAIAGLLGRRGRNLIESGATQSVIDAVRRLPRGLRDRSIEEVIAEALWTRGDWDGALDHFARSRSPGDNAPVYIAWRMAMVHYLRGDLDRALAISEDADRREAPSADTAVLEAWIATIHWARGDAEACATSARTAFDDAIAFGDHRARAAAHTALALHAALIGDRHENYNNYVKALDAAKSAGDTLQIIRIHANLGSHFLEEGSYTEARAELDAAMRLAELSGFAVLRALALTNRGEAWYRLGRFEEATADLQAAKQLYRRMGTRGATYPVALLGEIYFQRGDWGLARAAYDEAIVIAEAAQDVQALVPALAGVARLVAMDDVDEAARLAERALGLGPAVGRARATLAAGWIALQRGRMAEAAARADETVAEAGQRRDRPGMAEALELSGVTAGNAQLRNARLEQAAAMWREMEDPIGEARARLALAGKIRGDEGRSVAVEIQHRMNTLGARVIAGDAATLISQIDGEIRPSVAIQSLATFRVLRAGKPVPPTEWQSKKARDLLKLLIARRGRATSREVLIDALWPEEDPDKLANRLSVALVTVRNIFDPDKAYAQDHFVVADKTSVALDLDHIDVDIERFLAEAHAGMNERRAGNDVLAAALLGEAEGIYAGDFLEEDPYEDWSVPLREEARALYIAVARTLAHDALDAGECDSAIRFFLRVLERDPYDEEAHLSLAATLEGSGRHGEARRSYRRYVNRMEELDVEASPFPPPVAS